MFFFVCIMIIFTIFPFMIIVDNGVNNGNCVGNCLNNHIGNENGNLNNGDGKYVSLCAILRTRNIYPEVIRR